MRLFFIVNLLIISQLSFCQPSADSLQKNEPSGFKYYMAPVALCSAGLLTQGSISRDLRDNFWQKNYPNFHSTADNYLIYAPAVAALSLDAVGIKGRHTWKDKLILTALSQVLGNGITQTMKQIIAYPRPDGSTNNAFPSGHTTEAFVNATILHQEYGQQSVWYSVGGYAVASAGGTMRMLNNRHWLADVLFGAGVGMASTKAVYAVYPFLQEKVFKSKKIVVVPLLLGQEAGVYGAMRF